MKPFARLMLMTLGFGLLAVITGLLGPQPKTTNASTALNVNVANTPTVNARQSGAWNVGINGTPNVNVTNVPTVNLAPGTTVGVTGGTFNFSNTPGTPIFTLNNHSRTAVQLSADVAIPDGQDSVFGAYQDANGIYTVPAGMRLVIDSLTGLFVLPNGQKPTVVQTVTTLTGQPSLPIFGVPTLIGSSIPNDVYGYSMQFTAYADAGTGIGLNCERSDISLAGFATCNNTLYGHLEPQ